MAIAKWSLPNARSANQAGTALNSLANGTASALITYPNFEDRDLYAAVTIKLGSITPVTGGSVTLRVYAGDGIDFPDANGGAFDSYVVALAPGAGAKVVILPLVRLHPFTLRLQVVNNAGVTTAASGNELYLRTYSEEVI